MLLLGIDVGTSSIKVSVVDAESRQCIVSAKYPESEVGIISLQSGWAEQSPEMWWKYTILAIQEAHSTHKYDPKDIAAIGIAYQMHGLVLVDKDHDLLRDSIIWCDSRAVQIGANASKDLGEEICSSCLLNSPGNFTASKLAWVKDNEPEIYKKIYKMMLPGDFISMKLTGKITTTSSALSEGILYDYKNEELSEDVMRHFGFNKSIIPAMVPLFSEHGVLMGPIASLLKLKEGIPVSYKAGDQLNNALSLNVMQPGEVAATAGTSGVIYAITDKLKADKFSRVNAFVHVNHTADNKRLGILLCINGVGILNSWIRKIAGNHTYDEMNEMSSKIPPGSEGLSILPFGNGAERMLENKVLGGHINQIDFNKHSRAHIFRAAQEGIAFAFRYGLDIMRENGIMPTIIRAGKANLFLSEVFIQSFVNATGVQVELYSNDGSVGAALGAGIGARIYTSPDDAFSNFIPIQIIKPSAIEVYERLYIKWKEILEKSLASRE